MMTATLLQVGVRDLLADIPTDGPALVVYSLLVLFAALIWYGSRSGGSRGPAEPGEPERSDRSAPRAGSRTNRDRDP